MSQILLDTLKVLLNKLKFWFMNKTTETSEYSQFMVMRPDVFNCFV